MSLLKPISLSFLALSCAAAPAVWAATPASGEITDEALAVQWDGDGPYVVPNLTPQTGDPLCEPSVPVTCDVFTLNVNLSDEFRELPENQRESAKIGITFDVTTSQEDYDLYVYNASGALVGEAAGAAGLQETVTLPLKTLKNGAYTVTVIPYTGMGTNYAGAAQVGKDAKAASAGFSIVPQVGSAPLTVTLDARALSTSAPAGGYVFEFGDGSLPVADEDGVIEHTYQSNGQYLSRVRFSDAATGKSLASAALPVFVGELATGKAGVDRMGGALGLGTLLGLAGFGAAMRRRMGR